MRARQTARRFRRRFWPRTIVLMYHRVDWLPNDPQLLAVTPEHFAEHMAAIRQLANPTSLASLGDQLARGVVPARSVVVTFDDGYIDNLHHAVPLLARQAIPATVFVTAGSVGCCREFWWDDLDRILLQPGTVPPDLQLQVGQVDIRWSAGEDVTLSADDFTRVSGWHIERPDTPTRRHQLYRELYHTLHAATPPVRARSVDALNDWAGTGKAGRESHRIVNWCELRKLADAELIEIGAHTMTHPPLKSLPADEQRTEILESKYLLERAVDREVTGFAYPHGSMDATTRSIVKSAGFTHACSSEPEVVYRDDDPLLIPRLVVRDWDGPAFARWLKGWFGG